MSINDGAATSRLFLAHPPFWGSKMASKTTGAYKNKNPVKLVTFYLIMVAAIIAFCLAMVIGEHAFVGSRQVFSAGIANRVIRYGGVVVLLVGFGAYYWLSPALRAAASARLCS
jgi:hypothetical protein